MGNQNSIESRKSASNPKSIGLPKDASKPIIIPKDDPKPINLPMDVTESIGLPKMGKEAYLFEADIHHLIGKGGFAQVFRAIRKYDEKEFAVKRSIFSVKSMYPRDHQAALDEVRFMKENAHPLIVKVIDDFIDNSGHLCMVQELYTQGDFNEFLKDRGKKQFEEHDILSFLANIIKIIHHLNSSGIYHRDLKPENFLIRTEENGRIYLHLSDFGLAKKDKPDDDRLSSSIGAIKGTVEYLAPEILNSKFSRPNMSKQDVWSIGVIAYQLCTHRLPFKGEYNGGTISAILNDPYEPIPHNLYSDELI